MCFLWTTEFISNGHWSLYLFPDLHQLLGSFVKNFIFSLNISLWISWSVKLLEAGRLSFSLEIWQRWAVPKLTLWYVIISWGGPYWPLLWIYNSLLLLICILSTLPELLTSSPPEVWNQTYRHWWSFLFFPFLSVRGEGSVYELSTCSLQPFPGFSSSPLF